jgi:hypothetical protein
MQKKIHTKSHKKWHKRLGADYPAKGSGTAAVRDCKGSERSEGRKAGRKRTLTGSPG